MQCTSIIASHRIFLQIHCSYFYMYVVLFCSIDPQAFGQSHYGAGLFPSFYSSVSCSGAEQYFANCTLNFGNCSKTSAAGVQCSGMAGPCENASHTSCCTSNCAVSITGGTCYCNSLCHTLDNCCSDISKTCPQGIEF